MRFNYFLSVCFCLSLLVPSSVQASQYTFDQEKSNVTFALKHLGLTTADGDFRLFDGLFVFDSTQVEKTKVSLIIQSASVASENHKIPDLMRSENFFHADKYPQILFKSERIEPLSETEFNIHGHLTIRDKTQPAVFKTTLLDRDPENGHLFFDTETYIERKDYGIGVKSWLNPIMIAAKETLKISLHVEGIPIDT